MRACASGLVSARDAAITLLALTTGLRACDIIGLRLATLRDRGTDCPRDEGLVGDAGHPPANDPAAVTVQYRCEMKAPPPTWGSVSYRHTKAGQARWV